MDKNGAATLSSPPPLQFKFENNYYNDVIVTSSGLLIGTGCFENSHCEEVDVDLCAEFMCLDTCIGCMNVLAFHIYTDELNVL